jgi:flagellar biosynthesis chaperone FliJ
MHWARKWQCQQIAKEIVEILNEKGYTARYAENCDEAKQMISTLSPKAAVLPWAVA